MTAARTVAISIFALLALAPLSAYADGISLTQYTVAPATIYPGTTNGGLATTTTITVGFSERVSAHITIEDSTGSVVRSLYSSNGVTNPTPKVWDGTDSGGAVVAPGVYTIHISASADTLSLDDTSQRVMVALAPSLAPPPITRAWRPGARSSTPP